ncbi:MAG: glycosyltransferase [Porticoccaceae bacterium]|nr:glycosyltransferase [Porticoccaceae bacterium]
MKINIICTDKGWVYDEIIHQIMNHSRHTILRNSDQKCDITHYLPYYEVPNRIPTPSTAFMSHQEATSPLNDQFINAAASVDTAISMSRKYAKLLKSKGLTSIKQVTPGVDVDFFKTRGQQQKRSKLIAGYIGRQYSSTSRKNPELLKEIEELPFIELRSTNGELTSDEIPAFYQDLDVVICPAKIEGGPMAIQEGLASGVPVICLKNVGMASEYKFGVIQARSNRHFLKLLTKLYTSEKHIKYWNKPAIMKKMSDQVRHQTWELFTEKHDEIWESICNDEHKT